MEIELRHLRYFSAVAEELHFGRAAERLHIAQPSLSQQIRKLEREVGTELIDRRRRAIKLTPAGEALAAHTRRTFDDIDTAVTAAQDAARGVVGRLAVGFVETAAIGVVPGAVRRFRGTHPRVALELRELSIKAQTDGLVRGNLDLGFVRTYPGSSDLLIKKVIEEHFIAAVPAGHPLAGRDRLHPGEVISEPMVVIEREQIPGLYDETMAIARQYGEGIRVAQQASSVLSTLGLVSAGMGLALLPDSVRELAFVGIRYLELDPSPRTSILAVRHRDNDSPQIDPFLGAIT